MSKEHFNLEDVAVIVASRNEAATLQICIDSILKSSKNQSEIWIVDDQSTDETADILKTYLNKIHTLKGEGRGPGAARNFALKQTQKPLIVFTDGDCEVDEHWLNELINVFNDMHHAVAVGGPQYTWKTAPECEKDISTFFGSIGFISNYIREGEKVKTVSHNPTCNVMYKKEMLMEVNGFDENLWPCEDLELDLRLKHYKGKVFFTPKAVVFHKRPENVKGLFKMTQRYGFGHSQLVKKHGFCAPIQGVFVLTLFCLIFALTISPIPVILFILLCLTGLFGYFLMSFAFTKAIQFVCFGCLSIFGWNWGFIKGMIQQQRIANHE